MPLLYEDQVSGLPSFLLPVMANNNALWGQPRQSASLSEDEMQQNLQAIHV